MVHDDSGTYLLPFNACSSAFCLPLQEIDVLLNNSLRIPAILDTSLQITVIWHNIVQSLGVPINYQCLIEMEGANSATNWMVGCTEDLMMQVGNVSLKVHMHIVKQVSFSLLLGQPFQQVALCRFKDLPSGKVEVSVYNPADLSQRVILSTHSRTGHVPAVKMLLVCELTPLPLPSSPLPLPFSLLPALAQQPFLLLPPINPDILVLKYKHIDKKVKPIPAALPEEFCNIRYIPEDLLLTLPLLPTHPPDFTPGNRLTQERLNELDLNSNGFLWPEELKLIQHILKLNKGVLAWTEAEKGRFHNEYFSPVKIPVVEHTP